MFQRIITMLFCALVVDATWAQCTRLPDGSWQCLPATPPSEPRAVPTAMDIRIECPTARGSGTAVARLAGGGTLVVTSYHVIRDQPALQLHAGDGRTAAGQLAAIDQANDLAAVAVDAVWPVVNLGDEVSIGTPVQFRAFDAGVAFRKYYGQIVGEYRSAGGAGGFFASGRSVPGNSGGGVYRHGRLVGVVWGNPDGGTALVPIGPVKRLIERVRHDRSRESSPVPGQSAPESDDSHDQPAPGLAACDCEERWRQLESRREEFDRRQPPQPDPKGPFDWLTIAAAATGFSGPIGVAIFAAGLLLRGRARHSQRTTEARGPGGPRNETFRGHNEHRSE